MRILYRSLWTALLFSGTLQLVRAADPSSSSGLDLKAMDTSVSPCQNFYLYACGTWRKDNPIPPDQARWGRFDELLERNEKIERDILEKAAVPSASRTPVEQEIGDFYASCMDTAAIDSKGVQPIVPILDAIDKISSKQDLANEVVRLHDRGVRAFFSFYVRADAKNADDQIANADQGGLGLPDRDYYLKDDPRSVTLRKQYEEHIRNMFTLLAKAEGKSDADAGAEAQAVLKIETALAKASMDRVARRNPDNTYHKMSVDDLASLTPDFGWKYYVANIGIKPIQTLNVGAPDFMKALNTTIDDNNLGDLKTYMKWQLLDTAAEQLSSPFEEEDFNFNGKILSGAKEMQARWKRCVKATDRALGEALGQKFVEVAFNGPSKAKALQLVGEIENEMERDVKSADWMSPATKDQALTKLKQVSNKIGYPEKWRDYSTVKIARGDYFGDYERAA